MRTSYIKRAEANESMLVESNLEREAGDKVKLSYPNSYVLAISKIPVFKKYVDWAGSVGRISQDVPFNRFIVYTFWHLIFLTVIMWKVLDPTLNHFPLSDIERRNWKLVHSILTLYLTCFTLEGINYLMVYKDTMKAFKGFWRLFDFLTHFVLTISIICHWIFYFTEMENDCMSDVTTSSTLVSSITKDSESLCQKEEILSQVCVLTFAIGKVFCDIISQE